MTSALTSPPSASTQKVDVVYPCLHHLESAKSLLVLCALEDLAETNHDFSYRLQIYPRAYGPNGIEKVHPLGKSPVLAIGPKPEEILSEARLILQYLYDTYARDGGGSGGGAGLWTPSSEQDRARDAFFQEFANSSLLAKVDFILISELPSTLYPWGLRHVAGLFSWPFRRHFMNDINLFFQYMEDALSEGDGAKPWFGGATRGLSDFLTIFPMDMASQRGYFDGAKYPKVQDWLDRVHALPAYKRALDKGGKYNLKTF
ncbi:hypothetical protein RBB50_007503 [Rhinocladiella similis]